MPERIWAPGRRAELARPVAAWGHQDAVSVGDYHIPDLVGYALTGAPRSDDAQMLRLLASWHGQRQRVVRLIEASGGVRKPRFGPRMAVTDIRAI